MALSLGGHVRAAVGDLLARDVRHLTGLRPSDHARDLPQRVGDQRNLKWQDVSYQKSRRKMNYQSMYPFIREKGELCGLCSENSHYFQKESTGLPA